MPCKRPGSGAAAPRRRCRDRRESSGSSRCVRSKYARSCRSEPDAKPAPPAHRAVAAGGVDFGDCRSARVADDVDRGAELADVGAIQVTLQRQRVAAARVPVGAKARMADAPVIRRRRTAMERRVALRVLAEHAKETRVAELAAVACRRTAPLFRAGRCGKQRSLRVARVPGRDVDHAIDRICAPQARTGTANHFDALDVRQQVVLYVPRDAGEERRVDAARVAQHEQLLGVDAAERA